MRAKLLGGKPSIVYSPMHAAIVAITAFALAACTSMALRTAADYDRGGAHAEKLVQDADACAKQAEAHQKEYGLGPYDPTHGSYNWMYDSCMQAGGYRRKPP
ncbi:MAG TPA: hypothetical protein VN326_17880 [Casimicrobiaceae bacterium]|jgi:hypothetical protein|nr:hypothetical protein [Casimicrobiaceae bacterium]